MSLFDPNPCAQDIASAAHSGLPDEFAGFIGDRHQQLLEACKLDWCPGGDLLSLMPSVDRPDHPWSDGKSWLGRILGF